MPACITSPRLLSDNGPCYISGELKTWLKSQDIEHTRGAPYHPQTQGKIERYHRSMKNVVKLENYYYPWQLEKAIADWVQHYNLRDTFCSWLLQSSLLIAGFVLSFASWFGIL